MSPGSGSNVGQGDGTAGTSGAGPITDRFDVSARIRRLTRLEFQNTLSDLLGEQAGPLAESLEQDATATKYATGADRGVSANYVGDLNRIAKLAVVELAQTSEKRALGKDCSVDLASARVCAATFIRAFGARAWRRPVTDVEVEELLAVYEAGRATAGGDDPALGLDAGLDYAVRAVIQAPSFIFRTELGAEEASGSSVALTPFEAASALSYGLISAPPDAELTRLASSGKLSTVDELTTQGRRLLETYPQRYASQTELFVREWLGIDLAGPAWHKNTILYPRVTEEFKSALDRETSLFLQEWSRDASLTALLTLPRGFVSKKDAWLYGIAEDSPYFADGSPEFAEIALDPTRRAGVLTLPSFLGSLAHESTSSPVLRGVTVMKKLLCREPPPVPAVVPPLPPADPNTAQTTRARYAAHTAVPYCAGCHATFDLLGDTFEHYDAVGGYRDAENGVPIDSTGTLVAASGTVTNVADAVQLSALLAANPEVHACFVRQAYRFTSGQKESGADDAALAAQVKRFEDQRLNVSELMLSLVVSLTALPHTVSLPEP